MSTDRAKWFAGQVKKLAKSIGEIERLIKKTEEGLAEIVKAPIVSLPTVRDILRALELNRRSLSMAKDELRKAQLMMEAEQNAAPRQREEQMGVVVPFRRKNG